MSDTELQEQVQKALDWEPSVDPAHVWVAARDGVVTLSGDVRTYAEKTTAERVALGVYGVKAVANELAVRLGEDQRRTDADIEAAAVAALQWNTIVPDENITVSVTDGWVTLVGRVQWEYQRAAVADAVRDLTGVRGVTNAITLEPQAVALDVKSKIEAALVRSAETDARQITVNVTDGKVILSGNVHSAFERDEARHAAWAAPGVREVEDRMAIVS